MHGIGSHFHSYLCAQRVQLNGIEAYAWHWVTFPQLPLFTTNIYVCRYRQSLPLSTKSVIEWDRGQCMALSDISCSNKLNSSLRLVLKQKQVVYSKRRNYFLIGFNSRRAFIPCFSAKTTNFTFFIINSLGQRGVFLVVGCFGLAAYQLF